METKKEYVYKKPFKKFYPYYLSEHANRTSRRLHFIGTFLVIITFCYLVITQNWKQLWVIPIVGYGFAWVGHFFFEKNRPATFKQPIYSLIGDFKMFFEILFGKRRF